MGFIAITSLILLTTIYLLATQTVSTSAQKQESLMDRTDRLLAQLQKAMENKLDEAKANSTKRANDIEDELKTLYIRVNDLESELETVQRNGVKYGTCEEMRRVDSTLSSGMYWIDPDGLGIGDDPIRIYCDMRTGTTSISHDSEMPIVVTKCSDAGCYSRQVNYNVTKNQLESLIGLSSNCSQSIQYHCSYAPFVNNGVTYSWWNDRNGANQTFWAGSSEHHTCQCGIDGNCIDPDFLCNCDSLKPQNLSDVGVVTDKKLLPITRLNFGRTHYTISFGKHTLGTLNCSGGPSDSDPLSIPSVGNLPRSCEDLQQLGHHLNGFYSVDVNKSIETIYCNFTTSNKADVKFMSVQYQGLLIAVFLILVIVIIFIVVLIIKVRNLEQQKQFERSGESGILMKADFSPITP